MALTIACATCAKRLLLPENLLDQLVSCPSCHTAFTVADRAGRVTVLQPGAQPPPLPPPQAEPLPTARSAPAPRHQPPPAAAETAFVFRVYVTDDAQGVLRGPMQARVSASGLELRDSTGCIYQIAPGDVAAYLGGNSLGVVVGGRPISLSIVQPNCQKARLARDVVLFLNRQRPVPRWGDYQPSKTLRLVALLPMAAGLFGLALDAHVFSNACKGCLVGIGVLVSLVTFLIVLNEEVTHQKRFVRAGVLWGVSLVLGAPAVIFLTRDIGLGPAAWTSLSSADRRWSVKMPGKPTHQAEMLAGMGGRLFDAYTVKSAANRVVYTVGSADVQDPAELTAKSLETLCDSIRDSVLKSDSKLSCTKDGEWPLQNQWGRLIEFQGANGSGARVWIVVAGPRIHVLKATWVSGVNVAAEIDPFFQSLVIHP